MTRSPIAQRMRLPRGQPCSLAHGVRLEVNSNRELRRWHLLSSKYYRRSSNVMMLRFLLAVALGAALGLAGARATFLGWWTLLPWGAGALALGYTFRQRPLAVAGIYGFVLSFSFMVGVYRGARPLLSRAPFFALLGLVGASCAVLIALAGSRFAIRRIARRANGTADGRG